MRQVARYTDASTCQVGNRIFTDPDCIAWSSVNPQDGLALQIKYCQANYNDPACNTWGYSHEDAWGQIIASHCNTPSSLQTTPICKSNSYVLGHSIIDDAARQYCAQYPDDDFCSCFISTDYIDSLKVDEATKKTLSNPMCYYSKCINSGYKTQAQRSTPCPDVLVNCTNISANNGLSLGVVQSQQCALSSLGVPTTQGVVSTSNTKILLFIVIVLVLWYLYIWLGAETPGIYQSVAQTAGQGKEQAHL